MLFRNFKIAIAALISVPLAGCFYSETPLIAAGEGILPIDGDVRICAEDCEEAYVRGDGYAISGQDSGADGEGQVRFTPVLIAGERQIFVSEIQMETSNPDAYVYAIARRSPKPAEALPEIELVLLECGNMDTDKFEDMRANGWEIDDSSSDVTCKPPNIDALLELIRDEADVDALGADAWWAEQND